MMIKVILKKDVARVGKAGETTSVKDGFARNFLLPQGLALVATKDNIGRVDMAKKKLEQEKRTEKEKIEQQAEKLKGFSCTIAVEAQDDNLYGSISLKEIAESLAAEQIKVDENNILLDKPIKKLGIYEVEIRLHPEVSTKIKVWIVKK